MWQRDLGIEIDQKVWETIIHDVGWPVRDIKIINILLDSTQTFKKLGLTQSNECWKCKSSVGTCLHLTWEYCVVRDPLTISCKVHFVL